MLRINRETDYAIRVILALAKYPREGLVPSAVIRKEMQLPEALSLQIISQLSNQGLINTFPGRNGGIQLAHPPAEISLRDVILAMEGPLVLSDCLTEEHSCGLAPECPVQGYWLELQSTVEKELDKINFHILSVGMSGSPIIEVQ